MEHAPVQHAVRINVPTPTIQQERMQVIDALRGFALCGILIMNIVFFGLPFQMAEDPRLFGELNQPANHFWWAFMKFFMEGSMRGLFSVLFGAGTLLLISRLEKRNPGLTPADIYFRRLLWLLLFGLVNGFVLNWPGDILYHYAIVGMFIFAFRKASPGLLIGFVAFVVVLTMFFAFLGKREMFDMRAKGEAAHQLKMKGKTLTEEQEAAMGKWEGYKQRTNVEANKKSAEKQAIKIQKASYAEVFKDFKGFTAKFESSKFYGNFFFDIIIFFLLGFFLFKTGVVQGEKSTGFYAILCLAGYAVGFGQAYFQYTHVLKANLDYFAYYRLGGLPVDLYQVHRIGTTLGHLGLVIFLWKTGWFRWLLWPLSRMGQMAFTNYLSQSLFCGLIFYGYGLGYYGKLQRFELYYVWAGIVAFQLLFSVVWLHFFRFGPLEWVWRSLTYWKIQPLKKGPEIVEMI